MFRIHLLYIRLRDIQRTATGAINEPPPPPPHMTHVSSSSGYVIFSVLQLELEIQRSRADPEYTRSPSLFNERETRTFLFFFFNTRPWSGRQTQSSDFFFLFLSSVDALGNSARGVEREERRGF